MSRGTPLLIATLVACSAASTPTVQLTGAVPPALLPPVSAPPDAPGAAYLDQVATHLQPVWAQFLEDCRLRLPPSHPLNDARLAATATLVIDGDGQLALADLATSGNAELDRAVREIVADTTHVAAPPPELLADDDRVHLAWLFARDRRQAGAASARVVPFELPLAGVVDRLLTKGDLARAARRIARAPATDADREPSTARVMTAALREALAAPGVGARVFAVEAIGQVGAPLASELADEVRALLSPTIDAELRIAATTTAAALGDTGALPRLVEALSDDLVGNPRIALAETAAIVRLGSPERAVALITAALDGPGALTALAAHAIAPHESLASRLRAFAARPDARYRAAACTAIPATTPARPFVQRGLADPDASVRAACVDAVARQGRAAASPAIIRRVRQLANDRDQRVRARAIATLARLDEPAVIRAAIDPAPEVRVAATARATAAELRVLADDDEAEVRAAAVLELARRPSDDAAAVTAILVRRAADPEPRVRRAVAEVTSDEATLVTLANDVATGVATAALVRLVALRGRPSMTTALLHDLAAAPAGSTERVRIALAWLSASR